MRGNRLWAKALGLVHTVVEDAVFEDDSGGVIVAVRPTAKARKRCGQCGRRAPAYDQGGGRRRWRSLDIGTTPMWVEADAPRVNCREHGPTVAAVPWARHDAGHTRDFDDVVAWLAVRTSKAACSALMRVAWRTVGSIITRVCADIDAGTDRLDGLARIGIDEISYKKGHRYITVVVDHDSGALVWAEPGRDKATLDRFFEALGKDRRAQISLVSADSASWIATAVKEHCANAELCADPFHVIAWATSAVDQVRREALKDAGGWNPHIATARRRDRPEVAHPIKKSMWALRKNPENLTDSQRAQLEWIAKTHPNVYIAYLLKEALRLVFILGGDDGQDLLHHWIRWAEESGIAAFVALAARIRRHHKTIYATLEHGLSQGLIESTNTKIRVLTRIAYGFHHPEALIALAMLALGQPRPALPGRK